MPKLANAGECGCWSKAVNCCSWIAACHSTRPVGAPSTSAGPHTVRGSVTDQQECHHSSVRCGGSPTTSQCVGMCARLGRGGGGAVSLCFRVELTRTLHAETCSRHCRNNVFVPVPLIARVAVRVLVRALVMAPCDFWCQLRGTSSACRTCCSVSGLWSRRTRSTNAGCSRWGHPGVRVVCALPVTPRAVPFMMLCSHVCFLLLPGGCLLFCFLLSPFVLIDRKMWTLPD